ncbi:MAG: hypothetical protein AAF845_15215 [Bacteroidota bacterium]
MPAFTFEGRAYHTRVSDDFAALALVTSPLVDGASAVLDDAVFSFVEVRLFEGLSIGAQTNPRGIALYHWGPGGTRVDGPSYMVEEATVEIMRIVDGVAHGTIMLAIEAIDDDTPPGEDVPHTLVATFEAVAGQIPPP